MIFVSNEFVSAYGVGKLNTYLYYNTQGDTSERPDVHALVRIGG
jgi:hypothetical protein